MSGPGEVARLGPLSVTIERHRDGIYLDVWHKDCGVGLATLRLDREPAVLDEAGNVLEAEHHAVHVVLPELFEEAQGVWQTGESLPDEESENAIRRGTK